jgi:hypothetical protein
MAADVTVAVCPEMDPETGTGVLAAKQVELTTRTPPEIELPD